MLDFVDEDVLEKLAALDDLEVETDQTLDQLDSQLEAARLTPQEAAIIKAMRDRQLLARNRAQASTNRRNAPLPRAARLASRLRFFAAGSRATLFDLSTDVSMASSGLRDKLRPRFSAAARARPRKVSAGGASSVRNLAARGKGAFRRFVDA